MTRIEADVTVYRDWKPVADLTAAERLQAAYAIAEQSAVILADYKNLMRGHRLAIYAHMVALIRVGGVEEAPYLVALLDSLINTDLLTTLPENDNAPEPALT